MRPSDTDLFAEACPWEDAPVKQPQGMRRVILSLNEVAVALRECRRALAGARVRLSDDDLAALHRQVTQSDADELTSMILEFAEAFSRTMGLHVGVLSWQDFLEQMQKVDATVRELEGTVEQKTEEMDAARRRWQAQVSELLDAQEASRATESALRERVAHLERALVYASAQVGQRR